MTTARALWIVGHRRGELRTETLPAPGPGEVQVEALHSGVSRGTELLVFDGAVPESERERMRAPHQQGEFPWPIKYGYSNVGVVRGGCAQLQGRAVFSLYPHQSAYLVARDSVLPLPDGVPPGRAVLAANMETALNGIWDGRIAAGDRVAVVGAGVVGLLAAYLAALHPGTAVEVIDVDPQKEAVAVALGIPFRAPERAQGTADVVLHASGSAAGLATALGLCGREATVVELSWYGDREVAVRLGADFHSQRLRLQSSQVAALPAHRRARWTTRRRLALALELLRDSRLDALIGSSAPLDDLPQVLSSMAAGEDSGLCHRVDYER